MLNCLFGDRDLLIDLVLLDYEDCSKGPGLTELLESGKLWEDYFRPFEWMARDYSYQVKVKHLLDGINNLQKSRLRNTRNLEVAEKELRLGSFSEKSEKVHIHPFIDGNGRVGRSIMAYYLVRNGYPPIVFQHNAPGFLAICLFMAQA
ncbi:3041_t:CDS:2, partial [Ambispora gerdemannii]